MAKQTAEVVCARRFEVVDSAGKVRAHLGAGEDGVVGLKLYSSKGKVNAVLALTPEGEATLTLSQAKGKPAVVVIASLAKGLFGFFVDDGKKGRKVIAALGPGGTPVFGVVD